VREAESAWRTVSMVLECEVGTLCRCDVMIGEQACNSVMMMWEGWLRCGMLLIIRCTSPSLLLSSLVLSLELCSWLRDVIIGRLESYWHESLWNIYFIPWLESHDPEACTINNSIKTMCCWIFHDLIHILTVVVDPPLYTAGSHHGVSLYLVWGTKVIYSTLMDWVSDMS